MSSARFFISIFTLLLFVAVGELCAQSTGQGSAIVEIETLAEDLPEQYHLSAPYPNPFNPTTNVRFATNSTQDVKVTLHDMLGRKMKDLFNGPVEASTEYTLRITASNLKSGVYLIKLEGRSFSTSRTVALIK